MGVIRFVLVALLLCAPTIQSQDAGEVLYRLQKKYDSLRDLYASFTQIVHFGVTQSTQSFNGKMWMKKGNRYRIELDERTIVTDGRSVWTYSAANRQVLIDRFRDDPKTMTPEKMLATAPKNYFATIIGRKPVNGVETIVLKLLPKESKSLTKSMKVWVDPSEWLMLKAELLDVSDVQTTYITKDLKIDTGLDDKFFRFDAPPDVEVVDLRTSP